MNVLCTIFLHNATTNLTKLKINMVMTTNPTPETGRAQHNPDPYNTGTPIIGQANYGSPILGPLGVVPHYLPKDETWAWVYGN